MDSTPTSILDLARAAANKTRDYSSASTRQRVTAEFKKACNGKTPYEWQLDVTEALLLGLDSVVIAGTGAGKMMLFAMPLMVNDMKRKMIVVSPLNELKADQAVRFRAMGLYAMPANGDTYNKCPTRQEIIDHKYRFILTSPELLLEHPLFSKLMRSPDFIKDILAIVVDEAHRISQWGGHFRKKYSKLSKLRSFVSLSVPILATSATMAPAHVTTSLFL